jgi:hypothetical protein
MVAESFGRPGAADKDADSAITAWSMDGDERGGMAGAIH